MTWYCLINIFHISEKLYINRFFRYDRVDMLSLTTSNYTPNNMIILENTSVNTYWQLATASASIEERQEAVKKVTSK